MNDLISRQALKQILGINADDCEKCAWGYHGRCKRGSDFEDACCAIEDAPSAEQWIPVSERLPDNETYVLISKKPHPLTGKKWCVTIAGRFVDGRSRRIEWRDIGFGRIADDEILAWMPLPEAYAERRTDETN